MMNFVSAAHRREGSEHFVTLRAREGVIFQSLGGHGQPDKHHHRTVSQLMTEMLSSRSQPHAKTP